MKQFTIHQIHMHGIDMVEQDIPDLDIKHFRKEVKIN